jgi:hypothetical protein
MTRLMILAAVLSSITNGQDVPPPPKPQDNGPNLADTMRFIEEKLGSSGRVKYIVYSHDNTDGSDWTTKFSDEATNVQANVASCRIDFHWRARRDYKMLHDSDYGVLLNAVQEVVVKTRDQELKELSSKAGHPEYTAGVDPPVFVLSMKLNVDVNIFYLYDESLANRIAQALVHGVERCGGGSKDPF